MKKYIICVWFRWTNKHGEQEKDFNTFEVEADNENHAVRKAMDKQKRGIIFKTEIL